MKTVILRPVGRIDATTPEKVFFPDDHGFDMVSFLTNEFDNQHIYASIVEVESDSLADLQLKYAELRRAADTVVSCWESGDLAAAVRHMNRVLGS